MLTFRFTGPKGEMTEKEMLASGMVGKQIRFEFSDEWDGLRKVAVYKAGDICCSHVDVETVDTIPAQVLSKPLRRLYVGVCGMSEDGRVVLPAIYTPGPFIHIGAAVGDDPAFDPESSFWIRLEEAIEESVRYTPQSLTEEQKAQARINIGVSGGGILSESAGSLLLELLRKAVYTEDVSESILALETAMNETEEEEAVYYSVGYSLENVTVQPSVASVKQGSSCTLVLTPAEGYALETVTVIMGGKDITDSVYSGGIVTIASVTGDVVVTAKAAVEENTGDNTGGDSGDGGEEGGDSGSGETEITQVSITLNLTNCYTNNKQQTITTGNTYNTLILPNADHYLDSVTVTMGGQDITAEVFSGNSLSIPNVSGDIVVTAVALEEVAAVTITEIAHGTTSYAAATGLELNRSDSVGGRATLIPTGQYLKKSSTYRFSLGSVASSYYFGVQILVASASGLSFDSAHGDHLYFDTVTSREVDTGWMQADYTYTPTEENRIFTMNFKRSEGEFSDTHYAELLENVVVEEVSA